MENLHEGLVRSVCFKVHRKNIGGARVKPTNQPAQSLQMNPGLINAAVLMEGFDLPQGALG